jgi:hypothetical protein
MAQEMQQRARVSTGKWRPKMKLKTKTKAKGTGIRAGVRVVPPTTKPNPLGPGYSK